MTEVTSGAQPETGGPGLQRMQGEQRRKYLVRQGIAQLNANKSKTAVIAHMKAMNKAHCNPPLLVKDMPAYYQEARKAHAMGSSPMLDELEADAAASEAIDTTDPEKVAYVLKLARELYDTERQMAALAEQLAPLKARHEALTQRELGDAMKAAGVGDEFPLANDWKVQRRATLSAGLPTPAAIDREKDPAKKAAMQQRLTDGLAFLVDTGNRGLIKDKFEINLGKGETNRAKGIENFLNKRGIAFVHDQTVHPQTLGSFVREAIREGKEVPLETLGVYEAVSVKLVPPKKK